MTDDHLETFLRESEERIVELNNALLVLEEDPSDRDAMDRIFRIAHTLKGNCGAMGFQDESRLAHALEDLLDEIRRGRIDATPTVMDDVFDAVDKLEAALDDIEETGRSSVDPASTIASIRSRIDTEGSPEADVRDGTVRETTETPETPGERTGASPAEPGGLTDAVASVDDPSSLAGYSGTIAYVGVRLAETDMPGIDAMLVLEHVTDVFDLLHANPPPEAIQNGEFSGTIQLLVNEPPERVKAELTELSAVEEIQAADATPAIDRAVANQSGDTVSSAAGNADGAEVPGQTTGDASTEGSDDAPSVDAIKSVRVDVDQLDQLYGLVEQLVTSRIKLRQAVEDENVGRAGDTLDEFDKITSSLQDTVMDMRLIPFRKVVDTFPRLVRDLAREQEKDIAFVMSGTDIEIDRTILDEIADPLMHVLRNAVDHGIEPPDEREATGKPREGTIELAAARERDHVTITVTDDGRGLDPAAIRDQAHETGIRDAAELDSMSDSELYTLVFHPGFSTSEEVTDVSGRGVGMDVVNSAVSRMDGSVSIDSTPGAGTTVTLRLPVSVAIVRVLFVEVGNREYGVPIANVDEIVQANGHIRTVHGDEIVSHDDAIYPVVRLERSLEAGGSTRDDDGMLIRIRETKRKIALHCDAVTRQEEVVVKPFEGELSDVDGISGSAVVGDGKVVPILDVSTI